MVFALNVVILEAKRIILPGIRQPTDGAGFPDAVQLIVKLSPFRRFTSLECAMILGLTARNKSHKISNRLL